MFGFFNKKRSVFAPFDGQVIPIEEVPDEAFAKKIVGEGLAIMPESNKLIAPFDGKIEQIFDTKHAFVLKSTDNLQILVHVGINTGGNHHRIFCRYTRSAKKGYSTCTPIIFMNLDEFKVDFKFGRVQSGSDTIATYKKN